jgi:hypothetical protein
MPDEPTHAPKHVHGFWRRHTASFFRWLHIYLSMISFAILFFFAVTGLTLNHADWFSHGKERVRQTKGKMDARWMTGADASVQKLEVVEFLRHAHGIKGAVGDFRIEETQCDVSFKGPGYSADAIIKRDTGDYEMTETRMGFVAIINDLHKGRDSGRGWSLIIDISAVLMVLVSSTGTVLLAFVKRRRVTGYIAAGVGALLCWLAYVLFVP